MSQIMVLEGLGADDVTPPVGTVLAPSGTTATKISGYFVMAFAAYVVWDMFQAGPGAPGMTIAGLGRHRRSRRRAR